MSGAGFLDRDLSAILAAGDFDEPMFFTPAGSRRGRQVRGVFHAPTGEQTPGQASTPVLAQGYAVTLQESSLPRRRAKRDDLIKARGQTWRVWRVYSDGQGLLTLGLQKAPGNA